MSEESKICGIYDRYPKKENEYDGGLRLKGICKKDKPGQPLITYITVVYNRRSTLEACIQSVLAQKYTNVEYIIIDGKSTDGTFELIQKYEHEIDYYISQSDTGIYDAMNKGIALAKGSIICFMNSDDQCTQDASEIVSREYLESKADIICGRRTLMQNLQEVKEIQYPRYTIPRSVFRYVQMFHQSTYAHCEVFEKIGYFQKKYTLLADWIWEATAIDAGTTIRFIDEKLAKFSYDGSSCKGLIKRDDEWIEWAASIFPQIEKKDIETLIFCLDRGRHPMFSVRIMNRIARKYWADRGFMQTYYMTVLDACIEMCSDIKNIYREQFLISKYFTKYDMIRKYNVKDIEQMLCYLENKMQAAWDTRAEISISKAEVEELIPIKQCLNQLFFREYVRYRRSQGIGMADYFLRFMTYSCSKMSSGNLFLSRKFYKTLRAIWYIVFRGKFIEN